MNRSLFVLALLLTLPAWAQPLLSPSCEERIRTAVRSSAEDSIDRVLDVIANGCESQAQLQYVARAAIRASVLGVQQRDLTLWALLRKQLPGCDLESDSPRVGDLPEACIRGLALARYDQEVAIPGLRAGPFLLVGLLRERIFALHGQSSTKAFDDVAYALLFSAQLEEGIAREQLEGLVRARVQRRLAAH